MSDEKHATVLLFGAPGSGKGTQGKIFGTIPGFFHLSTGEIFRSLAPDSTEGQEVLGHVSRGELVPDTLTIRIWKMWLDGQIADGRFQPAHQLLLLDGIPRNVQQCQVLDRHIDVKQVIYLSSSNDEPLVERIRQRAMIEGRPDDANEEVIRHRFEVYRNETTPVLNHYPAEITSAIDPIGLPIEVLQRVLKCLVPVLSSFLAKSAVPNS